jgi:hypothetical protein
MWSLSWISRKTYEWKPWYEIKPRTYFTVITLHRFLRKPKVLYRYKVERESSSERRTVGIISGMGKEPMLASTDKYHGEVDWRYREWLRFEMLDPNVIPRVPYTGMFF